MELKPQAVRLLRRHLKETANAIDSVLLDNEGRRIYDIVSVGDMAWQEEVGVAITISYRSQAVIYEVWEVCFTSDSTMEGHGVIGCVARTAGAAPLDYTGFEYELVVKDPEVIIPEEGADQDGHEEHAESDEQGG